LVYRRTGKEASPASLRFVRHQALFAPAQFPIFPTACYSGEYRLLSFRVNAEIFNGRKARTGEGLLDSLSAIVKKKDLTLIRPHS